MAPKREREQEQQQQQQQQQGGRKRGGHLGSTTSLGKRRRRDQSGSPSRDAASMGNANEYGSQATPFARVGKDPKELVKVTVLGAAGGIGQPLGLLLMLHSEYIQHLALHDLADSIHGVALDLSHIDRQVRVTSHLGQEGLAEAVRGAKVIVIPAGLAQKPGMTRDDLFASNAEIMLNLAKTCATVAPDAALAIITNPVNSLVPLACEVYGKLCGASSGGGGGANKSHRHHQQAATAASSAATQTPPGEPSGAAKACKSGEQQQAQQQQQQQSSSPGRETKSEGARPTTPHAFEESFRRIFGVTTLDVVRASTLTAKSVFFKSEPNGLFVDPTRVQVPVVGGHAGKTIMPLLSQATPKLERERLQKERASTLTLVESIQQAGIDVLNAKRGRGSATLAMAYSACRFAISLLRAQSGEQNIVECAYVRHPTPIHADLDYFAGPLLLGKDGYVKSLASLNKLAPHEQQMLEEGARELKLSIARGEDFARERLYSDHK